MLPLLAAALAETVSEAFPPPPGATRAPADAFGASLRALPLHPEGRAVLTYDGRTVAIDAARVVDIPVGKRDLQQCADSALRLRATWERADGHTPAFHFTSGDLSSWGAWAAGVRPKIAGSDVVFVAGAARPDASDASFDAWLTNLYTYAGTRSLPLDTVAVVGDPAAVVQPGDLVNQPGSPGHVVVILDVARGGGETWVLVGQGYMPAMDFHVLDGPDAGWFPVEGELLPSTPIAVPWSGLRRWKAPGAR
jgi:hypothetical protein